MADIPRGVLISSVQKRRTVQQPFVWSNLQASTLAPAGAVQAPFRQYDWPNPVVRQGSMARHFLESVTFYTPPPIFPIDYQNPTRKRKAQQPDLVPNLVLNTLFTAPPVPFIRFDWQNPVLRRRVQAPYQFQGLSQLTLAPPGPDTTPDQFTFTDQTGVALSSTITGAAVTITGIDATTTFNATDGTIDKNLDGNFQASQNIDNGDQIRPRHTSSGSYSTATNTVVTGGGVSDTFTSVTEADPAGNVDALSDLRRRRLYRNTRQIQ